MLAGQIDRTSVQAYEGSILELLKTKLFIPRPRQDLVPRPRLTERLNAGLNKKLTLIAAPAGFGKTTLLSEWIPQSQHCVTWLSLDHSDNDPIRYWAYFISSLQQLHSDLGSSALSLLQAAQPSVMTSVMTVLVNEIAAFPDQFSTVLDDYHVIDHQLIQDTLIFLIDHMPANMHLVLTTRVNPPLPLARLRARDKLTELRAKDLRFSADEAAEFLTGSMNLNLSLQDVAALEKRTEGWIAGLQIAALSMQGREKQPEFIQSFSGSHRHILGYLASEVLDQRPKGTLDFLLKTSILDRLCGALCDAVTGETGGQETLEALEQANLFITPLDDEGVWYRYNHLFADVLQLRLKRTWPDEVNKLHLRAASWFARHGMTEEAVRHTLAGADYEQASNLIEAVAGDLLRRGASASLTAWLDNMPEEIVRSRSSLCLLRGWAYFMGIAIDLERAEEWTKLSLQKAEEEGLITPDLVGEAAALRAMIAATRSDVALSLEFSRQSLENLEADSPWRSAVVFCLGTAHYLSGDFSAAVPVFEEALRLSRINAELYIQSASAAFIAEILIYQGRLGAAMELCQQVLAWVDPALPQKGGVMVHGGRASILYEWNKLDAALAQVQSGLNQLNQVGGAWSAHVLYRILAKVQHAQGDWKGAEKTLDRSLSIGQNAHISLVIAQASALRACLHLSHGDLESAAIWAANSGLRADDAKASQPGWREMEYLALARVLSSQHRHSQALSLLERLLEAARADRRDGSAIAILVVRALVYQALSNQKLALDSLERALILAEPQGYIRTFVDEAEPMRIMLSDIQPIIYQKISRAHDHRSSRLVIYIDRLLSAFTLATRGTLSSSDALYYHLSERELEILHLISTGLSNKEIAELLVISLSTVKSHINNIYSKLGTQRRTQAVALAREIGLLSE